MAWFSGSEAMGVRRFAHRAECWLILQYTVLKLSCLPYRFWKKDLQQAMGEEAANSGSRNPDELLQAFHHALDYSVLFPSCLHQALALHRVLRRNGHSSVLCLGVTPPGVSFTAHAWLEQNGRVVSDPAGQAGACRAIDGPGPRP